jgi:hypothetical protein
LPSRRWRASPAAALLALAAAGGAADVARAQAYFQPNVAAFYQHQNSYQDVWPTDPETPFPEPPDRPPRPLRPSYEIDPGYHWWEDGGGWCGTTAWVNGFYSLDKRGYRGLFDHGARGGIHKDRSWLERFVYSNEDLAIIAGAWVIPSCADFPQNAPNLPPRPIIPEYVDEYGYGNSLAYDEYYWDDAADEVKRRTKGGDVVTPYATMFDLYLAELRSGHVTVVLMEGTGPWWWSDSFHVVTGAGVDPDPLDPTLWFADPDEGRRGTGWGQPYIEADPVPVGQPYYHKATLAPDGRTFVTGRYEGAQIVEIHTLAGIPEPAPLPLAGTGIAVLLVVRLARARRA